MALDDQMLADIGLQRSEIRKVADQLARFVPPARTPTVASGERPLRAQSAPLVVARDDEPKLAA